MAAKTQLVEFTREALIAGRTRADITAALSQAGWSRDEVSDALNTWAEGDFTPPVPRPRPYVSARDAFLYALMFGALAILAWHLVRLGHGLIDYAMPDGSRNARPGYVVDRLRWSIAALIVTVPLFAILDHRAKQRLARSPGARRSALRKWFGYATLFATSVTLLGTLVFVIYTLLSGDLTLRFILKTVIVGAVAGAITLYYRAILKEDSDGN